MMKIKTPFSNIVASFIMIIIGAVFVAFLIISIHLLISIIKGFFI